MMYFNNEEPIKAYKFKIFDNLLKQYIYINNNNEWFNLEEVAKVYSNRFYGMKEITHRYEIHKIYFTSVQSIDDTQSWNM